MPICCVSSIAAQLSSIMPCKLPGTFHAWRAQILIVALMPLLNFLPLVSGGWDGISTNSVFMEHPSASLPLRGLNQDIHRILPMESGWLFLASRGGDSIMMASMVPDLQASAQELTVLVQPRLEQLFRASFPGCTITTSIDEDRYHAADSCYGWAALANF